MLAIQLPEEIEMRLDRLAEQTGRTKSDYAREAILRHLEDLEDVHLAEKRLADIRSDKSKTMPFDRVPPTRAGSVGKAKAHPIPGPAAKSLRSSLRKETEELSYAEEQARLHAVADKFIGVISGDDPTRSQRVRELVRENLGKRYGR